jgi:glycosyltransferase involved in cell wall biosynthesis
VKAAVYNRFLYSMGGGERHSGMLAQVLAADGWQVDLITHTPVDRDEVADHVGIDLSGVRLRTVPDAGEPLVSEISAEYDLFVNASYMSRLRSCAGRSVYLCYFPTPWDHDFGPVRRWVVRRVGPSIRRVQRLFDFGTGWFPPEGGRRRSWAWTSGNAVLSLAASSSHVLGMDLGRPGATRPVTLRFLDGHGVERNTVEVTPKFARHVVDLGASDEPLEIHLVSDTFTPGPKDPRSLGVAVSRLQVGGSGLSPGERLGYRFPWLLRDPGNLDFLASYDLVLANSEFTRGWVRRYWRRDADVLFPPVKTSVLEPAPVRRPVILSVGRFLHPGQGHCKRQLELVRFFGALVRSGRLPGWELHFVGGLEPEQVGYFRQVQAAAAGLPVVLLPNAPRTAVEELFDTATVFWAATGYGDDETKTPWTFEHFGITTVEAMAGGAIPVVIDSAGQREIVRDGIDGFRWSSVKVLHDRTVEIARDADLRARLSAAAYLRAQSFSEPCFAQRWRSIAELHSLGRPAAIAPAISPGSRPNADR